MKLNIFTICKNKLYVLPVANNMEYIIINPLTKTNGVYNNIDMSKKIWARRSSFSHILFSVTITFNNYRANPIKT